MYYSRYIVNLGIQVLGIFCTLMMLDAGTVKHVATPESAAVCCIAWLFAERWIYVSRKGLYRNED